MLEHQPFAGSQNDLSVHLRILETTDLHVHIMPYDYFADRPAPTVGLARTAGLIRRARAEVPNCLLFDNGDFLQGSPMSDWAAANEDTGQHPMIAAMNTLGYDGATLGNHEFNYGLNHLRKALKQAQFPIVSANITTAKGDTPAVDTTLVPPWTILRRRVIANDGTWHDLNIGVIGFAPPQIADWEYYTLAGQIGTRDIIEAAIVHVPAVRAAGADVVIALSHSGIGPESHIDGMENASVPLAAINGIDAILTGHTHGVFPGPGTNSTNVIDASAGTLHGVPAVMAGFHGSHLGVIDLNLQRTKTGWAAHSHLTRAMSVIERRTPTSPPVVVETDAAVINSVRHAHDQVLDKIRLPLARTTEPLFSHFSMVAPSAMLTLLSDALLEGAQTALEGLDVAHLPLVTAVAPYKAGGWGRPENYVDIAAGPIAMRNAAELYPFPNPMCLLRLKGSDIAEWLETAALAFAQVTEGDTDQPLINASTPSYNYDVLHGLTYQIDPSAAPGARVSKIRLRSGEPLAANMDIIVCTNGYRAAGGGGYRAAQRGTPLAIERRAMSDVVIDYLQGQQVVTPAAERVWRFAPLAQTAAWFTSGPDASSHLHRLDRPDFVEDALTDNGFRKYWYTFDDPA